MNRFLSIVVSVLLFFTFLPCEVYAATGEIPSVSADGAVLMDAETGEILYSKNMDSAYPPASTTKLMTALLTFEKCNLDDVVTIGANPPKADGSKIYIYEGENIKVRDLLYALFLVSANDSAEALAEHISGSIGNFAQEMNKRAQELGCTDTNFVNPSGLYDKNHKTSAKDLALIMRELVKQPEYSKIATTLSYKIAPTNKCSKERPLSNENRLLQSSSCYYYKGCEGGKTGYTSQSQHSFVASASKDGRRLIVALIHDSKKTFFNDSIKLFNYGFSNTKLVKMFSKGEQVTTYVNDNLYIPLYASKDFYYVKKADSAIIPKVSLIDKDLTNISFKKNDAVIKADIICGDKRLGSVDLLSGIDHSLKSPAPSASKKTSSLILKFILYALIAFSAAVILLLIRKNIRKRKRKGKKKNMRNQI